MTNIIKTRNAVPATFGSVAGQLFPNNLTTLLDDTFWGFGLSTDRLVAPVNIRETDDSYQLEVVAPGLQKSDFSLTIEGDTLTVSFKSEESESADDVQKTTVNNQMENNFHPRWVRREFTRQNFERHFEIGDAIDREKISARYESGILCLTLPKKENRRPAFRQIDIQ